MNIKEYAKIGIIYYPLFLFGKIIAKSDPFKINMEVIGKMMQDMNGLRIWIQREGE
jgi:hypothetical protein